MTSIEEFAKHPVTILTAALGTVSQLFQVPFLDALIATAWSQISVLFTGMSVFAFTVIPNVDLGEWAWLGSAAESAAIVLAIGYGAKLLIQAFGQFDEELDND